MKILHSDANIKTIHEELTKEQKRIRMIGRITHPKRTIINLLKRFKKQ